MTHDDAPFTSDEVDEQIEAASGLVNRTFPAAGQTPETRLIADLSAIHRTDPAVARSLARVRERLLWRDAPTLEEQQNVRPIKRPHVRQERLQAMKGPSLLFAKGQKLSYYLARIAAAVLLVALVGGLIVGLVLVRHGGNTTTGQPIAKTAIPTTPPAPPNVYLGAGASVYKLDAKTGKLLWSVPLDGNAGWAPIVINGIVYESAQGGSIYALKATDGTVLWHDTQLSARWVGAPRLTVADGTLYACAELDGDLYAFNAGNGSVRWHANIADTNQSPIFSAVQVGDGVLYGSYLLNSLNVQNSRYTYLYAASATNGSIIWRTPGPQDQLFNGPVLANQTIYITSSEISHKSANEQQDSYAYAYDPATGKLLWQSQKTTGFVFGSPAVADGAVYFGAQEDDVYAVSAADGKPLWQYNPHGSVYPSPQVADGDVYVGATSNQGNGDNAMIALGASDGALHWKHHLDNYFGNGAFAVNSGVVYVTTDDGYLYALKASDGTQLWRTLYGSQGAFFIAGSVTAAP